MVSNNNTEEKGIGREEGKDKPPFPIPFMMIVIIILAYVVIFLAVTLDWTPEEEMLCDGEIGGYCYGDPAVPLSHKDLTSTSITIYFGGHFDRNPLQFKIHLANSSSEGTYYLPSSENGTVLILTSGSDLGTIKYIDHADNGKINVGDCFVLENLEADTYFSLRLVSIDSEIDVCFYCFRTLP